MRILFFFSAMCLAQLSIAVGAYADGDPIEHRALAFQAARFQAMIEEDVDSLDGFLADKLIYGHSQGWTETKAEFLATIKSRKVDYVSVTPIDVQVQVHGNVAVMSGIADLKVIADDREVSVTIRFLDVSRQTDGVWQLIAWQSVGLPPK